MPSMTTAAAAQGRRATWSQGLLVSVRDADEARAALVGASIVDVKEPSRGPLGAAEASVAADVITAVAGMAPVTLACGELVDGPSRIARGVSDVLDLVSGTCPRPVAVKAGPAGLAAQAWLSAFREFADGLPAGIEPVAVAYADHRAAACLAPEEVFAQARAGGATVVLVDTFDKSGPGLLATVDVSLLGRWISRTRDQGLSLALAGRLTPVDLATVVRLGADVVGVRAAACTGGRLGRIDPAKVRTLARIASSCRVPTSHRSSGDSLS